MRSKDERLVRDYLSREIRPYDPSLVVLTDGLLSYDRDPETYEAFQCNPALMRERRAFLLKMLNVLREEKSHFSPFIVEDLGGATGIDACFLATQFPYTSFRIIDLNPQMVEVARRRIERLGLTNCEVVTDDYSNFVVGDSSRFGSLSSNRTWVSLAYNHTRSDMGSQMPVTAIIQRCSERIVNDGLFILTCVYDWDWGELSQLGNYGICCFDKEFLTEKTELDDRLLLYKFQIFR